MLWHGRTNWPPEWGKERRLRGWKHSSPVVKVRYELIQDQVGPGGRPGGSYHGAPFVVYYSPAHARTVRSCQGQEAA